MSQMAAGYGLPQKMSVPTGKKDEGRSCWMDSDLLPERQFTASGMAEKGHLGDFSLIIAVFGWVASLT